jgi:hypothetical protein
MSELWCHINNDPETQINYIPQPQVNSSRLLNDWRDVYVMQEKRLSQLANRCSIISSTTNLFIAKRGAMNNIQS